MAAVQTDHRLSLTRAAYLYSAQGDSKVLAYIGNNEELESFLVEAYEKIKQHFGPQIHPRLQVRQAPDSEYPRLYVTIPVPEPSDAVFETLANLRQERETLPFEHPATDVTFTLEFA